MGFSLGAGFVTLHGVNSLLKGCCHLFQSWFNRTWVVIVFLGCSGRVWDGDIFSVPHWEMLEYKEGIKRCGRVERWFASRILSVCKVEVLFGVASHGGIGSFYSFFLSRIN